MDENGYGARPIDAGRLFSWWRWSIWFRADNAVRCPRVRDPRRSCSTGFTLVELVVVVIIVSILAVFAMAKLDTKEFDARGYFDQTQAMVRFAQKLAIAQRGLIYVDFTGAFRICSTPNNATCSCSAQLPGPMGAIKPLPSGVTLGAGTSAFCFDSGGRPLLTTLAPMTATNTVTVTGNGARTFLVEAETGYVHQ